MYSSSRDELPFRLRFRAATDVGGGAVAVAGDAIIIDCDEIEDERVGVTVAAPDSTETLDVVVVVGVAA